LTANLESEKIQLAGK